MVKQSYFVAKQIYEKKIVNTEGKYIVSECTGMKLGSANDYINAFTSMVTGKEYKRTINNFATKFYLENIKNDFGTEMLIKAIESVDKHLKYYNTLNHGNLKGIENIVQKYKDQL